MNRQGNGEPGGSDLESGTAWIHHLETIVPEPCYSQSYASERMQAWTKDPKEQRLIRRIYRDSGIEHRHSVITDFGKPEGGDFLRFSDEGIPAEPGTEQRNEVFTQASRELSVRLADRLVERCPGIAAADVTHVITVSCTGFYNPGPDYDIVQGLGLSSNTQRYHLGFMGCYAAFPALRMAAQFCAADKDAVVLVMCIEFCSLHIRFAGGLDFLLANSLFADGLGAAIVRGCPPAPDQAGLCLNRFATDLVTEGKEDMAWTLGDRGFNLVLSSYVPKVIGANIAELIEGTLAQAGCQPADIGTWAVHPGGKSIVERVKTSLNLRPEQVAPSRAVLRRYGNMSSATILFVLKEILACSGPIPGPICAMSFGPGLTIETAVMQPQFPDLPSTAQSPAAPALTGH